MGEKSTAVKQYVEYDIEHLDGGKTHVRQTACVDPGDPDVLVLHRDVVLARPLDFIWIQENI